MPPSFSTLFASKNAGKDWEEVCSIPDVSAGSILVSEKRLVVAGYSGEEYVLFYSDDKGKEWTLASGYLGSFLTSSLIKSGANLIAAGAMTDHGRNSYGALLVSPDNGDTWKEKRIPEEFSTVTSAAVSGNALILSGYGSEGFFVACTPDDGQTWEMSDIKVPLVFIAGICGTPDAVYLVGRKNDGTSVVLVSKDGGASFSLESSLSEGIFVRGVFAGSGRLFLTAFDSDQRPIIVYRSL